MVRPCMGLSPGGSIDRDQCVWRFSLLARRTAAAWRPGASRDRESAAERSPERKAQRQKQINDFNGRPIAWALRVRDKSCIKKGRRAPRTPLRRRQLFAVADRVRFASDGGRWRTGVVEATCIHTGATHPDWAIVSVRQNVGGHDFEACDMCSLSFVPAG